MSHGAEVPYSHLFPCSVALLLLGCLGENALLSNITQLLAFLLLLLLLFKFMLGLGTCHLTSLYRMQVANRLLPEILKIHLWNPTDFPSQHIPTFLLPARVRNASCNFCIPHSVCIGLCFPSTTYFLEGQSSENST